MGDDIMKQGIGNYKGLMICTRPNDKIQQAVDRPFVSRVEAQEQLGLNPAPRIQMNKPIKRVHYVLSKHKQWLEGYKRTIRDQIQSKNQQFLDKIDRQDRLRQQSINLINRRREQHLQQSQQADFQTQSQANQHQFENQSQNQYNNNQSYNDNSIDINPDQLEKILSEPVQQKYEHEQQQQQYNHIQKARPQTSALKKNKKEKPAWAKTEKQLEEEDNQECDDLLNFASNLDYDKYINDLEVQSMVKAIKDRVSELKTNPSIYDSQVKTDKEQQAQKMKEYMDLVDEKRTNKGENNVNNEGKSNASAKSRLTMQSIKETVEKIKNESKEEWDKSTTVGEQKYKSNIEEKLVKHLADDILKNNKYLRGIHSTNSIKQILIGEAKKHFEDNKSPNAQLV
ncbi:hypothetical protein TTHERM_00688410 (macronuclear) [Tetrahymena thermophila SB210]|uniref:Uncharacterized protein n=1 Tax=Tetrahymena thermophila (strain SB210) TaxID=312017 RepID=X1W3T2_TETTS|nr:hypothetical protein TTHERM_00688410 [Tetrahymena thermophila SB210]EAS06701.2 hypothetical protein TTHERM_00688410 [Tetrahymena thermophila SB210]|eukprot:XP_001026943.2 hypothetical protein TTHERM_00688410 [Tetrahymena thermophila SB210]